VSILSTTRSSTLLALARKLRGATVGPGPRYGRLVAPALALLFGLLAYGYGLLAPTLPFINDGTLLQVARPFHDGLPIERADTILSLDDRTPDQWARGGLSTLRQLPSRYQLTVLRGGQVLTFELAGERMPLGLGLRMWGGALALGLAALLVVALLGLASPDGAAEAGMRLAFLGLSVYFSVLPLIMAPPLSWVFEPLLAPVQIIGIGLTSGIVVFFLGYRHATRLWHPWLLPLVVYSAGIAAAGLPWLLAPGSPLQRASFLTERVTNVVAGTIALLAIGLSLRAYHRNREPLVRAQFRWLLWGVLVGVVPWLALWGVPTLLELRQPVPLSVALLPMLALPFSFALASLRYRLLDVDVVLTRTVVYLTLTVGLGLGYVLVTGVAGRLIPALFGNTSNPLVPFLMTLILAALFNPALRAARQLVDGVLYPGRRAMREQITKTMRELRDVEGWEALLPLLNERMPRLLGLSGGQVLLHENDHFILPSPEHLSDKQTSRQADGTTPALNGSLSPHLLVSRTLALEVRLPPGWPFERPLILQSWEGPDNILPAELAPLRVAGYQLAFVLVAGGRPVGLYALGRPLSGDWYDRATIAALGELADRVAGAVENANLLEQTAAQARLRHELTIARHIQESLLPSNHLSHGGIEVAALSVPASDVGGDLYAAQPLSDGGLALAVGDISGKGVGAALLMAVTSTMLTTIAGDASPPALLARLNQLLRNYTARNRQNVALCYMTLCQLEDDRYQVVAASAGAIPPLLRRADGTLEWLQVAGLPLGTAVEKPRYQPTETTLHLGDTLLLCTDGLLEARDASGALLSFAGVERALATAPRPGDAQAIARHMLEALRTFTGGRELDDDVTVMVVMRKR
jgi:serine phosphatase RsbU (regulator of sigma subunit)